MQIVGFPMGRLICLVILRKNFDTDFQRVEGHEERLVVHALMQLNALRDKITEIAWESCAVSGKFAKSMKLGT